MFFNSRLIYRRYFLASVFITVFLVYIMIYQNLPESSVKDSRETGFYTKFIGPLTKDNIGERLNIIIREFEDFDNALLNTVDSIQAALGNISVFVVADHLPYPPVALDSREGVKIVTLASDLTRNYSSSCPLHLLKAQYVFVIPDGVRIRDRKQVESLVAFLKSKKNTKAIAVPVGNEPLECQGLIVDLKRWSLTFTNNYSQTFGCPMVKGSHGLLMETDTFKSLAEPFARPFPLTFYIQARLKDWRVRVTKSEKLEVLTELYKKPHANWKRKQTEAERLRLFYEKVGVKQETLGSGRSKFYGCGKETARCFGTVINDMPEYLYLGRWTPPCCLKALRETARYVFSILEICQVRYWLEGGSLLGAARHEDIIPWDYDVDIGIYKLDIDKCLPLTKASLETYIDENHFVWEKAVEGDFYRVQYSETNHLHVDIFPFYSRNGTMTKKTWFPSHKQDTEFPETFLQPLTKIKFAGTMASAPNNVREFLEYKFGKGVIEKPRYPNFEKLSL